MALVGDLLGGRASRVRQLWCAAPTGGLQSVVRRLQM